MQQKMPTHLGEENIAKYCKSCQVLEIIPKFCDIFNFLVNRTALVQRHTPFPLWCETFAPQRETWGLEVGLWGLEVVCCLLLLCCYYFALRGECGREGYPGGGGALVVVVGPEFAKRPVVLVSIPRLPKHASHTS